MNAVELRPLSLGELLDRTFFLYRQNFFLFTGIAAIPYALFFVVNLGFTLLTRHRIPGPGIPVSGHVSSTGLGVEMAGGLLVGLIVGLAGFVAYLFSVGATVFAVSEIYMGRPTSIQASLRLVRGNAGKVFGVLVLTGLILIAGLLLFIIPGIYFACRISVATASALLEDLGASSGIRRSFELTKGFAGRAFMIYMLNLAMAWGVIAVFQLPFIGLIAVYAKEPHMVTIWLILSQTGSFLASVLVTPVSTIGFALFYYDLRVRKEAFDLQIMMQSIGGAPVLPVTGGVPSAFGRDAF